MRGSSTPAITTTRRHSLALVLAAWLGLRHELEAEGKKNRRKTRKKDRCQDKVQRKAKKTCAQIAEQCAAYFLPRCDEEGQPEECRAAVTACCAQLGACNFTEYMTCLFPPS